MRVLKAIASGLVFVAAWNAYAWASGTEGMFVENPAWIFLMVLVVAALHASGVWSALSEQVERDFPQGPPA